MTKSEICREWRQKHPDMPTSKLARIIFNKDGVAFKDAEDVRSLLRYIEGKSGKNNRKYSQKTEFFKEEKRDTNPYKLPKSEETFYDPYILKGVKRILLLSDIHIPYHSIEALTKAIEFGKKENPDAILLNGDTIDFYGLSRFNKDPRKRNFAYELQLFKDFIDVLKKEFPKAKLIFKIGNHSQRYMHYLWMKAGELVGVEEFELDNIIKARANGIDIVQSSTIIKANDLNIIHGHEFQTGFFSPVNVARGLFLRAKVNTIQSHCHQTSSHTERDLNNKITTTWSTGCLCELYPEYSPINKWNHGFAIIDLSGNREFDVRNYRIYKGKIFL